MTGGGFTLVDVGKLAEPAKVLIEKVSEGVGGVFRPFQIVRVAKAEAEAEKIRAISNLEITDIERRGLARVIRAEGRNQHNIEQITGKALPHLRSDAKPEQISNDWIANVFEKCKTVSDEDMQAAWAKLLAGEANSPGTFSKTAIQVMSLLEKSDAELFTNLCSFGWNYGGRLVPMYLEIRDQIYATHGINFDSMNHLSSLGLLVFSGAMSYHYAGVPKQLPISYYGREVILEFHNDSENQLKIGQLMLTPVGYQLTTICGSAPIEGFYEYSLNWWKRNGATPVARP